MHYSDQFGAIVDTGLVKAEPLAGWNRESLNASASMQGFGQIRKAQNAAHERRLQEAGRLYADVLAGREHPIFLQEAIRPTRDAFVAELWKNYPGLRPNPGGQALGLRETMAVQDYQALYLDVLDRLYYTIFSAWPIANKQLVRIKTLRDFRIVRRYLLDGMVTPYTASDPGAPPPQDALLGPAPQNGAIPSTVNTPTGPIEYSPLLYQSMASINWAAFVNDDLGIFKDVSNRLAIKGNRGIAKFITSQYVDANGPNTTNGLFQAGYHNRVTIANGASRNNPRLDIDALADAITILVRQVDSTGDPINITGNCYLVFGPGDFATAKNLKSMINVYLTQRGGVPGDNQPGQFVNATNWIMANIDLVYDPYLSIVASSAPNTWLLFCDPTGQNRPAIEVGFLQDFEEPKLFRRTPTTATMGGVPVPEMGDFFSNNQDMKIVGVMGASPIDGRSVVGSDGTGN